MRFIGASSAFGSAFLSNEAAEEIYGRDSRVITGGSVVPVGKALVRDGGMSEAGAGHTQPAASIRAGYSAPAT